jgi:hypothetical protein
MASQTTKTPPTQMSDTSSMKGGSSKLGFGAFLKQQLLKNFDSKQ